MWSISKCSRDSSNEARQQTTQGASVRGLGTCREKLLRATIEECVKCSEAEPNAMFLEEEKF
jgi:hypothetical protein